MKFIYCFLILGSFASFASSSVTLTNKSNPNEKIDISCEDISCTQYRFDYTLPTGKVKSKLISMKKLEEESHSELEHQRGYKKYILPYSLTNNIALEGGENNSTIGDEFKDGSKPLAVARTLSIPVLFVTDTVLLPVAVINYLTFVDQSGCDGKNYKKLLQQINNGEDWQLKQKRFSDFANIIFSK